MVFGCKCHKASDICFSNYFSYIDLVHWFDYNNYFSIVLVLLIFLVLVVVCFSIIFSYWNALWTTRRQTNSLTVQLANKPSRRN